MTYPELSSIDSTPDQDLGLTIEFKLHAGESFTQAKTPGEYLAERVTALLQDYELAHVTNEKRDRIVTAFEQASDADKAAAASALKIDLVIVPPDAIIDAPVKG